MRATRQFAVRSEQLSVESGGGQSRDGFVGLALFREPNPGKLSCERDAPLDVKGREPGIRSWPCWRRDNVWGGPRLSVRVDVAG